MVGIIEQATRKWKFSPRTRAGGLVIAHPCGGGQILATLPLIALPDFVTL
jgi:hypothetical protein